MKAVIVQQDGSLAVQETQVPKLGPKDILTKTKAIALNPTDWKGASPSNAGNINGCDYAGIVEEVGSEVTHIKKGDKVAAYLRGNRSKETGAFAEYVRQEGSLVWKIPEGTSFEEAASLGGIAPQTAWQALYLKLELPQPSSPSPTPTPVLIFSGATAVGLSAIQLAKASGLKVITTSSSANFELLKSLGADATYDYSDPEVSQKIKKDFPGIKHALDTFSEKGSVEKTVAALDDGGKVIVLLPVANRQPDWKVEVEGTVIYSALGEEIRKFGPEDIRVIPNEKELLAKWYLFYPSLIESGKLKAPPLRIQSGLEGVPEGLKELKEGKIRATKLVYTI